MGAVMENFARYAVYAAPEPGPLADFAARWLGWDPATGETRMHPQIDGLPAPIAELTATPRKYGFHATLKPPFRLPDSSGRAALEADLAALAAGLPAVMLEGLALTRIGGFLALTPEGDTRALERFATAVVIGLDAHRAPAPRAEIERRRAAGLTPTQDAYLAHWGYPYVLDEFRFHFTLTGKLDPEAGAAVRAALWPLLWPLLPRPFPIRELCLFGEDDAGLFHLIARYALTG